MNLRFADLRAYLAQMSIHELLMDAAFLRYERGWDRKLDLDPTDYALWLNSPWAQRKEYVVTMWMAVTNILAALFNVTRCDLRGKHLWEDAGSYANPDSGAEHLRCRCCGFEFNHTYY